MKASLILIVCVLALLFAASTTVIAQSATPTTVGPVPTATPVPGPLQQFSNTVTSVTTDLTAFFGSILALVGTLILLGLSGALAWRLVSSLWGRQLVMDPFAEAVGDADLKNALPGLTFEGMRVLTIALVNLQQTMKDHREMSPSHQALSQSPPPTSAADDQVTSLLQSVQQLPSQEVKVVAQVLAMLFKPHGSQVTTTFQRKGAAPGTCGISLEVSDLSQSSAPTLRTIWEPSTASGQKPAASQPVPGPLSIDPIQAYTQLGMLLNNMGLFDDATLYLQEALRRQQDGLKSKGKPNQDVLPWSLVTTLISAGKRYLQDALRRQPDALSPSDLLAKTLGHLQAQQATRAAYTAGKRLQTMDLLAAAEISYVKSLPASAAYWPVALGLIAGDRAAAYLALAQLYGQAPALLVDEAIALLQMAVEAGSRMAMKRLDEIQRKNALTLTKTGLLLYQLGQYTDAEKYLTQALDYKPDDPGAEAALVAVRAAKPPITKTDAPPALLADRYAKLLGPAGRWLAIELARRSLVIRQPRLFGQRHWRQYSTKLANLIGALYESSALTYQSYGFFLYEAVSRFQDAIVLDKDWYQPYENMADTYVLKAQASQTGTDMQGSIKSALDSYRIALNRIAEKGIPSFYSARERLGDWIKRTRKKSYADEQKTYRSRVKRRVEIGQATAQLLSSDPNDVNNAIAKIEELNEGGWKLADETEGRVLYNLGSWYALAYNIPREKANVPNALKYTGRYLACSVVRDPKLAPWLAKDPQLSRIRERQPPATNRIDDLLRALDVEFPLNEDGSRIGSQDMNINDFKNKINKVLTEAKWTS